jgi:hypothetical protein
VIEDKEDGNNQQSPEEKKSECCRNPTSGNFIKRNINYVNMLNQKLIKRKDSEIITSSVIGVNGNNTKECSGISRS